MGMKKQWTGREKLALVLEGLKGECRISELCNEHGISKGRYYKWRDKMLADGAKLFERGGGGCNAPLFSRAAFHLPPKRNNYSPSPAEENRHRKSAERIIPSVRHGPFCGAPCELAQSELPASVSAPPATGNCNILFRKRILRMTATGLWTGPSFPCIFLSSFAPCRFPLPEE